MNISTLIGFVTALTVFFTALGLSSKNLGMFLDTHAILIVIGGTVAASLTCFSLPQVWMLMRVFVRRMLGTNKHDYAGLIGEVTMLSQARRRGNTEFENAVKKVVDPFLKDAAQVLFWMESDVEEAELRDLLETRAQTHFERYIDQAEFFRVISKFPPAFGLMGTTLGMIALLQSLGGANAQSSIGPAMSVALIATLYGIVLTNFLFVPIAENLTQQTKEDQVARRLVVEGVMMIAGNKPTKFVEEKCRSYLLPSERGAKVPAGGKTQGARNA